MKVSYNQLQEYFDKKLPPPQELGEAFTFHAFEVDGIEEKAGDFIFDLKILPDRTCYIKSADGIAREITAILGLIRKAGMAVIPAIHKDKLRVNVSNVNEMLDTNISAREISSILARMDIGVEEKGAELLLSIPSDRLDLVIPADIADEVGRIYGYEKIPSILPQNKTFKPSVEKTFYYCEKIKSILLDLGFSEIYSYTFASKGDFKIEKPLASDKGYLRTNLAEGVAKALEFNLKNAELLGLDAIKIFEIGKIFTKTGEKTYLCFGISGAQSKNSIFASELDNVNESLVQELKLHVEDFKKNIVNLGSKNQENKRIAYFLEIDLDGLIKQLSEPKSYSDLDFIKSPAFMYEKFSLQPFVARDIALFVPSDIKEDEVAAVLRTAAAKAAGALLIKGPDCFDRFTKGDKTSFAFRMIFQALDRNLTDEEVNGYMELVYEAVKAKGWEVR